MQRSSADSVQVATNSKASFWLHRSMQAQLAMINRLGTSMSQNFEGDFPDEETRRRWHMDLYGSTSNQGINTSFAGIESNAAYLYHALNQQGPLTHAPHDLIAYQPGVNSPCEHIFADAPHHQWACQAMGLTIPTIPDGLYHDSNGEKNTPAQPLVLRKRRQASIDYSDPSSDVDEHASSSSNAPTKRRRTKKVTEGKKTGKRFAWPEDLHRDFVSAIYATGLKHATASNLVDAMNSNSKLVTPESIKMALQKYRSKHEEVRRGFMSSYEAGLLGVRTADANSRETSETPKQPQGTTKPFTLTKEQHGLLSLPKLTEEEARSHVGASLGYLMGLLITLEQQLVAQRAAAQLNSFRQASGSSLGETIARMHSVREQVRQVASDNAGTLSTAPSTATLETNDDDRDILEQRQDDPPEESIGPVPVAGASDSDLANQRAKAMVHRHGSMDIASLDGLENMDDDHLFSFLTNM